MEFARGIINIRFAPRNNRSTFDTGIWKAFSIQIAKRTHDLGKSVKRSADYLERSGSGGYVSQSGGVTAVEIACMHVGYQVR